MFPMMKPALLDPDRLDEIQAVDRLALSKLYSKAFFKVP